MQLEPTPTSDIAPSLQGAPIEEEKTGLVQREPAMSSGMLASVTVFVTSMAIILRYTYGITVDSELLNAVIDLAMLLIGGLAPLIAAKFTRERVTPVN